jgi:hypothetical protein
LTEDGDWATVESNDVQIPAQPLAVYSLSVEGGHTYFVEDGQGLQDPIWVHNICGSPASLLRNSSGLYAKKCYSVYYGTRNGVEVYVGITKQSLVTRLWQHNYLKYRFDKLTPIADGLTKRQARAIEQALIENNSTFRNEISSISSATNPWYKEAMNWANAWLGTGGQ